MKAVLGVIADDLTGACDVAAGVTAAGMSAEVRVGVPDAAEEPASACVIVALKSRTAPVEEAVAGSAASADVLRGWGVERVYQKYCSTFDSTVAGTIGPVADALLDRAGPGSIAVGTPVTPAVGRTMHRGHLFVGDRLLSESSLAHHPLTPMTDADLVRVLSRQTPRRVGLVPTEVVRAGAVAVGAEIERLRSEGVRHVLVDGVIEADLDAVAEALHGRAGILATGAAGLATALARRAVRTPAVDVAPPPAGRRLVLSGSGSERTRAQVAAFRGGVHAVDVAAAMADPDAVVAAACAVVSAEPVALITATAHPDEVTAAQARWGRERVATRIEAVLGRVAAEAVRTLDVRRILVAGGETSGAVVRALGIRTLTVRRVVDPGVPWMRAGDPAGRILDLCLKSGNFGAVDLFARAWEETA